MYKREFDAILSTGAIPQAVLLYGESSFLIHHYSGEILRIMGIKEEERNAFYFGEYDMGVLRSILGQSSLFGDRSFVQLKIEKKIPKKELDSLLALLPKNPNAYLLVEFYRSQSKSVAEYSQDSRAMAGSFRGKKCAEVRFFPPTHSEAMSLLRNRAKELVLDVEERWLLALLAMQNQDLALAYNELEKFALLPNPPSMRDLERLSYGLGSVSIEELCEALIARKDALKVALALENEGIEEMAIVTEMERFFYQLFLFYAHIRVHGKSDSSEILGYKLPKTIEEKKASMAIRLKEGHYFKLLTALQEWRIGILQGRSRGNGLVMTLMKLQAILQ
ncbi:MAG: DNA polymerase III subunit delta [Wolinella sp.]